ncbi:MAG: hypothetical protein R2800_11035 [Flavipsychrobacter sp.]
MVHTSTEMFLNNSEVDIVIEYLNNGVPLLSLTLWLMDGDKNIGPYRILSDSEWIWPSHFSYYINNSDYRFLNKEFVTHVLHKNRFSDYTLTDSQKEHAYSCLSGVLNIEKR